MRTEGQNRREMMLELAALISYDVREELLYPDRDSAGEVTRHLDTQNKLAHCATHLKEWDELDTRELSYLITVVQCSLNNSLVWSEDSRSLAQEGADRLLDILNALIEALQEHYKKCQ